MAKPYQHIKSEAIPSMHSQGNARKYQIWFVSLCQNCIKIVTINTVWPKSSTLVLKVTRIHQHAKAQGWGLLRRFPPFLYFSNFSTSSKYMLAIVYHVHIWQVSPQLSCGDTTCQIWMRFKECIRYFCQIENFAYGEIDERNFSNPHSRPFLSWVLKGTAHLKQHSY